MGTEERTGYASGPCYPELAAIVVAGGLHVVVEIVLSEAVAVLYNMAASIGFLAYVAWRLARTENAYRFWGMRLDNFWRAVRAQLIFAAVASVCMVGFGLLVDSLRLPTTFWLTLGLYPLWGIAQQFALQNLIARNLSALLRRPVVLAFVSAALFSGAHYPRLPLVGLTLIAGFFFTLIYRRYPNIWAVGIAHGCLGGLAFYIVLGEDPGADMLGLLGVGR